MDSMRKDLPSNFLLLSRLQLCLPPSFALVFKLFLSKFRVDFLLLARGAPPFISTYIAVIVWGKFSFSSKLGASRERPRRSVVLKRSEWLVNRIPMSF